MRNWQVGKGTDSAAGPPASCCYQLGWINKGDAKKRADVERLLATGEPNATVDVTVVVRYTTELVLGPRQLLDDEVAMDDLAAELLADQLDRYADWEIGVGPVVIGGAKVDLGDRSPSDNRI